MIKFCTFLSLRSTVIRLLLDVVDLDRGDTRRSRPAAADRDDARRRLDVPVARPVARGDVRGCADRGCADRGCADRGENLRPRRAFGHPTPFMPTPSNPPHTAILFVFGGDGASEPFQFTWFSFFGSELFGSERATSTSSAACRCSHQRGSCALATISAKLRSRPRSREDCWALNRRWNFICSRALFDAIMYV